MLHTYLLALSIAGSSKVQGAPADEAFGSDSTKFVKVPWDVLQSYYFRASRMAMAVPEAARLAWLEERDIADRSAWVSQFREGDEPLGQVVHSIMERRGAHWDTPIQSVAVRPDKASQPQQFGTPQTSKRQRRGQQKGLGKQTFQREQTPPPPPNNPKKLVQGTVASTMRNGATFCPDFNKGKCNAKGASCNKGTHKCAKVLRNGRACAMPYHGAHNCRNP